MNFESTSENVLSAGGERKKDAMLHELDACMRRRNTVRGVKRASAVAVLAVGIPATVWLGLARQGTPGTSPLTPTPVAEVAGPALRVALVATEASIMDRLTAPSAEPFVRHISDAELRSLLAASGTPVGFIRTQGRVILAGDLEPQEPASNDTSS